MRHSWQYEELLDLRFPQVKQLTPALDDFFTTLSDEHVIEQYAFAALPVTNCFEQYWHCTWCSVECAPGLHPIALAALLILKNVNPHSREQHLTASFLRFWRLNSFWQTIHVIFLLVLLRLHPMAGTAHRYEVLISMCSACCYWYVVVYKLS